MNGVGNESDDYKVIYFYWSTVAHFYTAFFKFNTTYSFSIAWYLINLTATFFLCQVVPFLPQIIIIPLQWRYMSLMEDMRRILFLTIAFVCSQSELFSPGKSKFRGQMTWRPHKSICQRLQTLLELQPTDLHKGKRHRMLQLKKCYTDGMMIPLTLILTFTTKKAKTVYSGITAADNSLVLRPQIVLLNEKEKFQCKKEPLRILFGAEVWTSTSYSNTSLGGALVHFSDCWTPVNHLLNLVKQKKNQCARSPLPSRVFLCIEYSLPHYLIHSFLCSLD